MAHILTLRGAIRNVRTGHVAEWVAFREVEFVDHPQRVADALNQLADQPAQRDQLPGWAIDPFQSATTWSADKV
jgi:hypothetical protein